MTTSALTENLRETLACFDDAGVPRTTNEVADRLDLGRRSTYDRLDRLVERGRLETKKVGASARVWWRPPSAADRTTAGEERPAVAGPLIDVIDDAEVGLFVLDADLEVVWLNETAERYFDLDRNRALGRDNRALVTEHLSDVIDDGASFAETVLAADEANTDTERFECHVTAGEDREERWLEYRSKPIESGDYAGGRIELYYDVTDRKRSAHACNTERTLLERVLEASPTGIAIFDTDGEIRRANQQFSKCLGLTETDPETYVLGGLPLLDEDGDVIPYAERPAARALATGESVVNQHGQVEGRDGQTRWLSINAEPLDDDAGVIVTVDDITQLKEQAKRLERQHDDLEAELDAVFERIDDAFYALDDEFRFTYVNDRAETLLGHSESELLGRNIWQALSVPVDDPLRDRYQTALATQTATSFERYSEPLDIWEIVKVFPSESGLSIYFTDISEQKERERDLEESERRYRTLVENFPNGMVTLFDDDLEYTLVGGELVKQCRLDPDQLVGAPAGTLFTEPATCDQVEAAYQRALDGETTTFEVTRNGRELWIQVSPVTDDDGIVFSGMAIYQDITERKRKERQLREHEATLERTTELLEQSQQLASVGAWELDVSTTPADLRWTDEVYRIHGLSPEQEVDLEESISFYHPEDQPPLREAIDRAIEDGSPYDLTLRIVPNDGDLRWVRSICDPVQTDGEVVALRGAFQDITERIEHEQDLERQREQLAALNNLNDVVRSITDEVIAQSTREEIERVVCERLAEAESYLFAWVGDVDVDSQTVNLRAEAGVDGYLDEITISTDPDDERSQGPTGRAILERETQTSQDIEADSRHDPWRDHIEQYGFRSSAAIPIVYEDTVYGVLNVYADRPNAFEGEERAVVSQLGEVVGHAIAATERKRALMSDDVVELQFRIRDIFAAVGADATAAGTITLDHIVPIENDEYLAYGTLTEDAIAGMDALVETIPHWADITYRTADGPTSFELRLSDPPVLSTIASLGGAIERVVIEDGDYRMTVLLAPGADVRRAIDVVQTTYPAAELLKHRQIARPDTTAERIRHVLTDELTDRQRAALEAAYHAGFFEWPRDASGEDVSESLEIAPATFHQHLRRAQKKIFESLLSGSRAP
ncbi:PAS domain S-box-containing protein [Natrinema hispanicum]|uniref:histidine kinase n=1 Tax=Natrinema hispanicum TaxID=392421 RepID=A0A482Y9F9_9EURY|nr:PAS domain S-box protein [Natrinema hispanicum]RZV08075.1 PAS domain S-box-containing protein [Natrinema hispanicum]